MTRILLNLGCGPRRLPGFVNIDTDPGADLQLDVTCGLPFPDASVDGIVSEHFLEHISQAQTIALFREFRRVLVPGGVVRIATPDLTEIVDAYARGSWREQEWPKRFGYGWIRTRCEYLNIAMRHWGHLWVYDEEEIARLAAFAGLAFKRRWPMGESDVPEFRGIEHRRESVVVELVRPSRPVIASTARPRVSVLIPAYNARYFGECLDSVLAQSYTDLEILIGDDCPTSEIAEIVAPLAAVDPRIDYLRNRPALGAVRNYLALLDRARGEYIKFLNDDDRLHPHCIARMVEAFARCPEATLVTSHRRLIDGAGNELPEIGATRRITATDARVNGSDVGDLLLAAQVNFVGEPSTTLFRRADAVAASDPDLFSVGGFHIDHNVDVAMWLNLLSRGDLVYLVDSLSDFRLHAQQAQQDPRVREGCLAAWDQLREHGARMGFLTRGTPERLRSVSLVDGSSPAADAGEPLVSIVIPVFNKWRFTAACLDALRRNTAGAPHEVIVIDNASSDETQAELARAGGNLRIIRNDSNLGFARACNQGAMAARGRYVLFLNNDTEPRPGWLEPLVRTLEEEADVAVVGGKLLFPDGSIQHAGVGIAYGDPHPLWPFHFHYREPEHTSREARDLDAITGACLMIRREVFFAKGAFDVGYVNGLEDIDLCLRIREAGWRVRYVPSSVLMHHESVSDGRFQAARANIIRFHERWLGRLERFDSHCLSGETPRAHDPARPGVSIVVVARDALDTITPCIESILRFSGPQDEVVLVDDSSSDATAAFFRWIAQRYPERVRLLQNPRFAGAGASLARALDVASREWVAVVADDVRVFDGWLEGLTAALTPHPEAAGVSPIVLAGAYTPEASADPAPAGTTEEALFLSEACMLLRRDALDSIGGPAPDALHGAVHLDLSLRMRLAGFRILEERGVAVRSFGVAAARIAGDPRHRYLQRQSINAILERVHREVGSEAGAVLGVDDALTSIVILIRDNLDLTRECVESVYRWSWRPFELILVDNGSAPEVAEWAATLQREHGNVVFVRNAENQGYAFGTNQGLARARGEYIVLLNNDVVVTPGWLARQIALLSIHDSVGMVGPRTNYTAGGQLVENVPYSDHDGMLRFAEEWAAEHAGEIASFGRVTGLCMVLRRDVLERVGGFDTCFGIGNFEDDDLCLRVQRAGYRVLVANDVFIHHYGSSTFRSLGVDYAALMRDNFEIFRCKWNLRSDAEQGYDFSALVEAREWDPDTDRIPAEYEEVFHPAAPPLPIGGEGCVRLLYIPDLADAGWTSVLSSYLAAFGPNDGVELVVRVEPPLQERLDAAVAAATECLRRWGVDPEHSGIVMEASRIPAARRGGLYTAAATLLESGGPRASLYAREARACGIPVLRAATAEALRATAARASGAADSARYGSRIAPTPAVPAAREARWRERGVEPVLGVIMIVRNEEENLPALFATIADVADEVVVVDTGSTDETIRICREWGVTLVEQPWTGDFAAARNRAVDEAGARYLLWLDGDDRVPPDTALRLAGLRDRLRESDEPPSAYVFQIYNVDATGRRIDTFLQTRLFPRLPGVRYRHPVHEEIVTSLLEVGIPLHATGWELIHTGYSTPEVNRRKALRNQELLRRALEAEPDSVHHLLHMAQTLAVLGRVREAEEVITRTIRYAERDGMRTAFRAELHTLRGTYHVHTGAPDAAEADFRVAIELAPEWAVSYAHLAELQMRRDRWDDAWETVRSSAGSRATAGVIGFALQRVEPSLALMEARLLTRRGETDAAASRYADVLAMTPADVDARLEWGRLLLNTEEFAAARVVLEPLGEDEAALDRFVDVAAAIGRARYMTGDPDGASACLAPLLDLFAEQLPAEHGGDPLALAGAMIGSGYAEAAKHMLCLAEHSLSRAA